MTVLRRTQPDDRAPDRMWVRAALLLIPVGLFGCGTATPPGPEPSPHAAGTNDPAWITSRPALPPPETDRINYDERTRTLTLYNLPGNDRWLVQLPGESRAQQVPPKHRLPDVDTSEVMVSYTRPGFKPSTPVSVKQIQDSGGAHVSLAEQH
jgi:cholesterol transport system auxiliary component